MLPGDSDRPSDRAVPFNDATPWQPWTPVDVAGHLAIIRRANGLPVRWAVAGGWALDLFLGRTTREHEDLEIVVLREDVSCVLAAFGPPGWRWHVPTEGWLHPLSSAAYAQTHQTWLWSEASRSFVLDVFRDVHDGDTWICRRDESIRLPWLTAADVGAGGVPFLVPEIVLLFKAKHARAKDIADLRLVLPALASDQREWLRTSLREVHPDHEWLDLI